MGKMRKTPSKVTRFRLRFTFWLDIHKPDEQALSETIETLKTKKLFAKTIRDGIKLVCSLMDGRLDLLFSLYPWVREEFEKRSTPRTTQALEEQLARLEYLMGQGMSVSIDTGHIQSTPALTGPKPLAVKSFSLPRFEDDDDEATLILTKSTSNNAALNFINTMKGLQQ